MKSKDRKKVIKALLIAMAVLIIVKVTQVLKQRFASEEWLRNLGEWLEDASVRLLDTGY